MKKMIIIFALILICVNFAIGDTIPDTQLDFHIITEGNLNSRMVTAGKGNVNTDLYCQAGGDCKYNLYNGQIDIPGDGNGTYNLNSYQYSSYTTSGGRGLTLNELNTKILYIKDKFLSGDKGKVLGRYDTWDFLAILSSIFVTRPEYDSLVSNVNYLANKIDQIEAENTVLRAHLNVMELDKENLECQIAIQKAYRFDMEVRTPSGMIANPKIYGDRCITVG